MNIEGFYDAYYAEQWSKALNLLKITEKTEINRTYVIALEMMILNRLRKLKKSAKLGEFVWEGNIRNDYEILVGLFYIEAIEAQGRMKNARDKLEIIGKIIQRNKIEVSNYTLFHFHYQKAGFLLRTGKLQEALQASEINLDLVNHIPKYQSKYMKGKILHRLGTIFDYMGQLQKATEHYHKAEMELKNNDKFMMGVYLSLGTIYKLRGLLDESMHYYLLTEKLAKKRRDRIQIAQIAIDKGSIFIMKGDTPKGLEQYEIAERTLGKEHPLDAFFIYGSYFELYADLKDFEKANYYFNILNKHDIYLERAYYKLHMNYYRALLLKLSKKTRNKAQAMDLFEKISTDPVIDHSITFQALIHYLDMLINDLVDTRDEDTFNEIIKHVDRMETFAYSEEISDLLAKAYMIRAKCALIEGDGNEAKIYLQKAKKIADEYGYTMLSMKISNEYDELFRIVNKDVHNQNVNLDLRDRLANSKLGDLVTEYSLNKPRVVKIDSSIPHCLFITRFDNDEIIELCMREKDEEFDTLRNTVKTLLSTFERNEDVLDRLEYNDYTILSYPYDNWIISIIFTGASFYIESYIDQITLLLKDETITALDHKKIKDILVRSEE